MNMTSSAKRMTGLKVFRARTNSQNLSVFATSLVTFSAGWYLRRRRNQATRAKRTTAGKRQKTNLMI